MGLKDMSENKMDYFCDEVLDAVQLFYTNPKKMEEFEKWKQSQLGKNETNKLKN